MAQQVYRANLSSAIFPLALSKSGRSVIIPGPDNNFDRRVDPQGSQKDAGIPQAIYLENVIPSVNGYESVGYITDQAIPIPGGQTIKFVKEIYSRSTIGLYKLTIAFLSAGGAVASGTGSLGDWGTVTWVGTQVSPSTEQDVYTAVVGNICYLLIRGATVQLYTVTEYGVGTIFTNITASVLPAGILNTAGDTAVAICSSFNYLILAKKDRIYWSSTTTPTDFTASLVTGAGSEEPNNTYSWIRFVFPHETGFYIYTLTNIISAQYTGNSVYPWRFREIENTNLVPNIYQVHWSTGSPFHTVMETSGQIKLIYSDHAEQVGAEITELFERDFVVDTFNYTTNTFSISVPNLSKISRVYVFLNRYILISAVNTNPPLVYSYVYVFDILLKRYGKLKISHTHIVATTNTAQNAAVGFINATTGACSYWYFDSSQSVLPPYQTRQAHAGVLVLGKFQYVRPRFIDLDEIELESTVNTNIVPVGSRNFSVFVLPSLDGKNFLDPISPTLDSVVSTGELMKYTLDLEAKNVCVGVKGEFNLNTLQLTFHLGGKY